MIHEIISSLELSLPNATIISSITGLNPDESNLVTQYIVKVLEQVTIDTLSDKDKLTVLKLHVKVRGKAPTTIDINDYVTPEKRRLIEQI